MFSGTHYGIKVDMGWLKDDVDGLKQVVDFLNKDNIKFVLLPVANQRFKIDVDRVGGGFRRHFNPRSREGSDVNSSAPSSSPSGFQSTLPRGERPTR